MMRRILFCVTFLLVGNGAWAQQQQEDDRGVIRLDPNDPTLDAWKELRDMSNDPKREPGPINIQRMPGGLGWTGIPTFFGSPVVSGDLICVGGHGLWTLPRLWKTPETPGERGV